MEEDEQGQTVAANFPRPPPFYKSFTPENIARLQELREQHPSPNGASVEPIGPEEADRQRELAPGLQHLIPPPLPSSGSYRSFGEHRDINEPLPNLPSNIEQLFPSPLPEAARPHHLLKISKSLLLNYLEFVGILAANPELAKTKIDDLRTLFFNAHQLINEYRPHQARESLIAMMEQRLADKRAQIADVKRMRDTVDSLLAEIGDAKLPNDPSLHSSGETKAQDDSTGENNEQKRVWEALNDIEVQWNAD